MLVFVSVLIYLMFYFTLLANADVSCTTLYTLCPTLTNKEKKSAADII